MVRLQTAVLARCSMCAITIIIATDVATCEHTANTSTHSLHTKCSKCTVRCTLQKYASNAMQIEEQVSVVVVHVVHVRSSTCSNQGTVYWPVSGKNNAQQRPSVVKGSTKNLQCRPFCLPSLCVSSVHQSQVLVVNRTTHLVKPHHLKFLL